MTRYQLIAALAVATAAIPATAGYTGGVTFPEEAAARAEQGRIIRTPIAGVRNSLWFDYRTNINEASKELATDLRNASDAEDVREVWDEYRGELRGERRHYIEEMAERGYRTGIVEVLDYEG